MEEGGKEEEGEEEEKGEEEGGKRSAESVAERDQGWI